VSALTPLDIATGMPFGAPRRPAPLPAPAAGLDAAILPALRHGPCLVSFSGGRDSSAVLAAAVAVARREGLPEPVPVTLRAPHAPRADESAWQERVVGHLGLGDWVRLDAGDELDAVGPHARRALTRTVCCGRSTPTSTRRCSSLRPAARC
jgi:asparagine synthase (glutamine-hydrolysing)